MYDNKHLIFITCAWLFISSMLPLSLFAYVMGSSNYRIDNDSINIGGSSYSTSSNYSLGDSIGEVATGNSTSTNYRLAAGYWIPSNTYISISSTGNVSLSSINGLTGGTAIGSSTYTVITNNGLGYQLTVTASTSPALKAPNASIADYVPAGADPDFTFTVSSSDSRFGFSPEGVDILTRYRDNGSVCNFGVSDTNNACWDGFSTSSKQVAVGSASNEPNGATTTIKYQVKIGSNFIQDSQAYNANITVTATTL